MQNTGRTDDKGRKIFRGPRGALFVVTASGGRTKPVRTGTTGTTRTGTANALGRQIIRGPRGGLYVLDAAGVRRKPATGRKAASPKKRKKVASPKKNFARCRPTALADVLKRWPRFRDDYRTSLGDRLIRNPRSVLGPNAVVLHDQLLFSLVPKTGSIVLNVAQDRNDPPFRPADIITYRLRYLTSLADMKRFEGNEMYQEWVNFLEFDVVNSYYIKRGVTPERRYHPYKQPTPGDWDYGNGWEYVEAYRTLTDAVVRGFLLVEEESKARGWEAVSINDHLSYLLRKTPAKKKGGGESVYLAFGWGMSEVYAWVECT